MTPYERTVWVNDETDLNEDNMNKIEEQLEKLTTNAITESKKDYVTNAELNKKDYVNATDLENKNYATETFVTETINNTIGSALGGSY